MFPTLTNRHLTYLASLLFLGIKFLSFVVVSIYIPARAHSPVPASSSRRRANSSPLDVTRPSLAVIRPLAPVAAAIVASTTRKRDVDILLMVVGSSCPAEDTQDMSECVLVGFLFYRRLCEPDRSIIARDYFYHSFKR